MLSLDRLHSCQRLQAYGRSQESVLRHTTPCNAVVQNVTVHALCRHLSGQTRTVALTDGQNASRMKNSPRARNLGPVEG